MPVRIAVTAVSDGKLGADLVRELQDMDQEEALDEMKKELEEEPWQ